MFQTPKFHLGSPTQVGPLTVFPVWTDAPQPTRPLRARLPKGATIGAHDDGATGLLGPLARLDADLFAANDGGLFHVRHSCPFQSHVAAPGNPG